VIPPLVEQLAEAERFYMHLIKVPEYGLKLDCMKFSYEFRPIAELLGKRVDEMLKAGTCKFRKYSSIKITIATFLHSRVHVLFMLLFI